MSPRSWPPEVNVAVDVWESSSALLKRRLAARVVQARQWTSPNTILLQQQRHAAPLQLLHKAMHSELNFTNTNRSNVMQSYHSKFPRASRYLGCNWDRFRLTTASVELTETSWLLVSWHKICVFELLVCDAVRSRASVFPRRIAQLTAYSNTRSLRIKNLLNRRQWFALRFRPAPPPTLLCLSYCRCIPILFFYTSHYKFLSEASFRNLLAMYLVFSMEVRLLLYRLGSNKDTLQIIE